MCGCYWSGASSSKVEALDFFFPQRLHFGRSSKNLENEEFGNQYHCKFQTLVSPLKIKGRLLFYYYFVS